MRRPTNTRPRPSNSITPTQGRYGSASRSTIGILLRTLGLRRDLAKPLAVGDRRHRGEGDALAVERGRPPRQAVEGDRQGPSDADGMARSEEHTSELQSLMRISYAVF